MHLGGALRGEGEGTPRWYVDLDYAGCLDEYQSTSGQVIIFGGAVDCRSRNQKWTNPSMTDAKYYAFVVDHMRLTQISHLLNELGIPTIPHVFSETQSLIPSIKNSIYHGTAVAHIATKYSLTTDMATDPGIDLSYIPSAEMLANCFTKPLPKPACLKQCAGMGMIRTGLSMVGNGLMIGIGNGFRNGRGTLGYRHGNGIGIEIRKAIGNAVRK